MQPTSSAKSPGYSRRRESVEDHVAQARRLGKWLGIKWTKKLGSRPFVEDLIKKGIIDGPLPAGGKSAGPGVAQRFRPRDLRALLEVLRLKSRGATRRKTWILQLWLRGREYGLDTIRQVLVHEMQCTITNARATFSKTGRFTGSFDKRFRRARGHANKSKYDEAFKIMSALMVQPTELQHLDIDVDAIAGLLTENTRVSKDQLAALFRTSIAAAKANEQVDVETNQKWSETVQQLPGGDEILGLLSSGPSRAIEMVNRAHGAIDDGFGVSGLVRAAQESTDEQLLTARRWHQAIRFNKLGAFRTVADLDALDPAQRRMADMLFANDAIMQHLIRQGPEESTMIFGIILNDEIPARAPNWNKNPMDVSGLLEHLRHEK